MDRAKVFADNENKLKTVSLSIKMSIKYGKTKVECCKQQHLLVCDDAQHMLGSLHLWFETESCKTAIQKETDYKKSCNLFWNLSGKKLMQQEN